MHIAGRADRMFNDNRSIKVDNRFFPVVPYLRTTLLILMYNRHSRDILLMYRCYALVV